MARSKPRLILLRHGETEWSKSGQHTGRTDLPLTAEGIEQARATGLAVSKLNLHNPIVFTSPRQRAIVTAELAGLVPDHTTELLAEWDYGEYEGITTKEIRKTVPGWTVWTHPCPGGETHEEVAARADDALTLFEPMMEDRDVVLVGHGHFSRVLVARWTGMPPSCGVAFAMSPAGCTILGYERKTRQIHTLNATFYSQ
ncbi:acid phosphatase [Smaragdicoccus niigatensis]|uniref:acid phosphatase n=1 Tax=Smaragdicoccus niigatensis TaxID=359359 RepID=UPI000376835A|nr:acid phosphatase [Smaragdicoccus niigatensis]